MTDPRTQALGWLLTGVIVALAAVFCIQRAAETLDTIFTRAETACIGSEELTHD